MGSVVIKANASLSGAIEIGRDTLLSIRMPSSWTAANLSFQGSTAIDGTFNDIYDSAGNELVAIASTSRIIVDIPELAGIPFLKIRSGTTAAAVVQGGDRTIDVLVK